MTAILKAISMANLWRLKRDLLFSYRKKNKTIVDTINKFAGADKNKKEPTEALIVRFIAKGFNKTLKQVNSSLATSQLYSRLVATYEKLLFLILYQAVVQ